MVNGYVQDGASEGSSATMEQNFRMISGSFAPSKFYPSGKSIDFFHKMQVKVEG
jgi:hypothetical protein